MQKETRERREQRARRKRSIKEEYERREREDRGQGIAGRNLYSNRGSLSLAFAIPIVERKGRDGNTYEFQYERIPFEVKDSVELVIQVTKNPKQ